MSEEGEKTQERSTDGGTNGGWLASATEKRTSLGQTFSSTLCWFVRLVYGGSVSETIRAVSRLNRGRVTMTTPCPRPPSMQPPLVSSSPLGWDEEESKEKKEGARPIQAERIANDDNRKHRDRSDEEDGNASSAATGTAPIVPNLRRASVNRGGLAYAVYRCDLEGIDKVLDPIRCFRTMLDLLIEASEALSDAVVRKRAHVLSLVLEHVKRVGLHPGALICNPKTCSSKQALRTALRSIDVSLRSTFRVGPTLLHLACASDSTAVVALFMRHHRDPDVMCASKCFDGNGGCGDAGRVSSFWVAPLFVAVRANAMASATVLLASGANATRFDTDAERQRMPLYEAARLGLTQLAVVLLIYGAPPLLERPHDGLTPEQAARACGNHATADAIRAFVRVQTLTMRTTAYSRCDTIDDRALTNASTANVQDALHEQQRGQSIPCLPIEPGGDRSRQHCLAVSANASPTTDGASDARAEPDADPVPLS